MKKKLLSLVLAGAMVASTSVSAFASGVGETTEQAPGTAHVPVTEHVGNGEITGSDDKQYTTDVEITGQVLNNAGEIPPSTFNVTIPTTASFTVGKGNNVISTDITIKNNGTQNIDVYADKFIDLTPGQDKRITVVKETGLTGKTRNFVSLNLEGTMGIVYLKTEDNNNGDKNGVYHDAELLTPATGEDLKLTTISKEGTGKVTLKGTAGGDLTGNSVSDKFTLRLKIKKSATK